MLHIYQRRTRYKSKRSRRTPNLIGITLDEAPGRFEIGLASAGTYPLMLSSVPADPTIKLHSGYIGRHLYQPAVCCSPPPSAAAEDGRARTGLDPVIVARRHYIYDHLQRLQDFLGGLGMRFPVTAHRDDTLLAVELWRRCR